MREYLRRTEEYLAESLIPFWAERIEEPMYGGFQTNYDRDGKRTEVTQKSLLCQGRCIFTLSHAVRLGFDWPGSREMIAQGVEFLLEHFKDPEYDGYYWLCGEKGGVEDDSKVVYGHAFVIYGLAEYALLTGDERSRREAERVLDLLLTRAVDIEHGGFYEHFDRAFRPVCVRGDGVYHKSFDVHMHLMEAFTALYELTHDDHHRRVLERVIGLIFRRLIHSGSGLGVAMFAPDWRPIANVQLGTLWGADRFDKSGKPPEITSYGHNIEFAWLFLHSQDVLGHPREESVDRVLPIFEHTLAKGVDREHGGVFVEGPREGDASETNKEFWQQAEALVGFLDAYALTGDDKYLDAFRNVHDFVFSKVIHREQGEWFPLLDREGNVLRDYMGDSWKTCYHTIRGMCEVVRRLRALCA